MIAGPTGVGKSRVAMALAPRVGGEIVNYDSVQVYRGFDIGSAKPSADDRRLVPHHLIDVVDAGEVVMVGDDLRADVEGAQHAGLAGVLVRTGKFTPADLQADVVPDAVLDSIADLPRWWAGR